MRSLYTPGALHGHCFRSAGLPMSDVARVHRPSITLTPQGNLLVAGSNPNNYFTADAARTSPFPTPRPRAPLIDPHHRSPRRPGSRPRHRRDPRVSTPYPPFFNPKLHLSSTPNSTSKSLSCGQTREGPNFACPTVTAGYSRFG